MKEKYIDAHMKAAEVYAQLSSAKRLQVGCVVVKDNTIIGIGYNGMPAGWENDCEYKEYPDRYDKHSEWADLYFPLQEPDGTYYRLKTRPEVLHAETNAIAKIARSTNSSDGAALFVTHAPCLDCAKIIYQAGINSVYYRNTYRSTDGVDFLQMCNIHVEKV
jgi:dCMP deaminase